MTTRALLGPGLFTGVDSRIEVGPSGESITIRRGIVSAKASVAIVDSAPELPNIPKGFPVRNTTLLLGESVRVATVEHVMSAAAGLGHWHAMFHVDGPEVPIDDGSAQAFVSMLSGLDAGSDVEPIIPSREIVVTEGASSIRITPRRERGLRYTYVLDYGPDSPIKPQEATWKGDPREYATEIAPARTFSLVHEVQYAQKFGLFSRFTPRDLLVVGADGQPIDNAWRFPNEPARHKLLDLIGDLALLGRPLQADVTAMRSGHALTHRASVAMLS